MAQARRRARDDPIDIRRIQAAGGLDRIDRRIDRFQCRLQVLDREGADIALGAATLPVTEGADAVASGRRDFSTAIVAEANDPLLRVEREHSILAAGAEKGIDTPP